MDQLKREALLVDLVKNLEKAGSWAGETHVQKTTFFLQEMLEIPLGFEFILYKHGPFSFDLRDELASMRADVLLRLDSKLPAYGPSIVAGEGADALTSRFPKTIERYRLKIDFAARQVGTKDVSELERLATALWVTTRGGVKDAEKRATLLVQLKPHVDRPQAQDAVKTVDRLKATATSLE